MAATRRLQKELLDIRREEKETVSIILFEIACLIGPKFYI
jgi:hypothetical protein